MSRIVNHLTDMVTAINGGSYTHSESFTAARKFFYDVNQDKNKKLTVAVYPRMRTAENANRNSTHEVNTVELIVRKPGVTDSEVDSLLTLVDELVGVLVRLSLTTAGSKVIGYSQEAFYDDFGLHEQRLFVSTVSFEIWDQF